MDQIGQDDGLRPGAVGGRQPQGCRQPALRLDVGADDAAVLDRRVHRLDGGAVLRGIGHDAVPLPHRRGDVVGVVEPGAPAALRQQRRRRRRARAAGARRALPDGDDRTRRSARPTPSPSCTPITESGPWKIYRVADSDLVVPLDRAAGGRQPPRRRPARALARGRHVVVPEPGRVGGDARRRRTLRLAARRRRRRRGDGGARRDASTWSRRCSRSTSATLDPVTVSNVDIEDQSVQFDVDQVGVPVLVKVSYFPNWRVDGAEGPYRIGPNQMVVVPTVDHGAAALRAIDVGLGVHADHRRRHRRGDRGDAVDAAPPARVPAAPAASGADHLIRVCVRKNDRDVVFPDTEVGRIGGQPWARSSAALASRASISSPKLFWKLLTPSRSRVSATSSTSTPTSASAAQSASASSTPSVDGARQRAVVVERLDRGVGQRVDRVRPDQVVDVERVGVGRVLRGRARPQRALHAGAAGRQRIPARPGERLARTAGRRAWPGRRPPCRAGRAPPASRSPRADGRPRCRRERRRSCATLATFDRSAPSVAAYASSPLM